MPRSDAPDIRYPFITRSIQLKARHGEPVIEEYVPPGTYQLDVSLNDEVARSTPWPGRRQMAVPAGEGPIDLPPLELGPPDYLTWVGNPAPRSRRPTSTQANRSRWLTSAARSWSSTSGLLVRTLHRQHAKIDGPPAEVQGPPARDRRTA